MNQFLNFLTKIKSFWKLYKDYGYNGETIRFIIDTYEKLLCERTKTMSKPTYCLEDILREVDKWYEEREKMCIRTAYIPFENRIDFSIEYRDLKSKEELIETVIKKLTEKVEGGEFPE